MADDGRPDELPKVTAAFLRRVEELCPRRVAFEHHNRRGNRPAPARWRVANQLTEHARVAHIELGLPSPAAFTPLPNLLPEERRVYEAAAGWYMQLFGERAVRCVDHEELDEWETAVPELGIRLVGRAGLPLEDAGGRAEIRLLRVGGAAPDAADPLASPDARFALLREAAWLAGRSVRLVQADLLYGGVVEHEVDVDAALSDLRPWLRGRLDALHERIAHPLPRPGLECGRCRFVAGCNAHG
ncbi:MAG TPA: hypothetical protein VGO28_02175 [Acidimicrobiia bacterium]